MLARHPSSVQVSRRTSDRARGAGWFAVLVLVACRVSAAEPISLERALATAREQNPELRAARQRLVVARGRLVKARYWNRFNPTIEGGLGSREFEVGGSAVEHSGGISLEVEVAGQRGKRIEEAERNLARVEAEVADAERHLTADVTEAFYRILYLRRRSSLFHEVAELNGRLRRASTERVAAGEAPTLEANLAVVRDVRSRADALGAERDERNARRGLERLLGLEPAGVIEVAGDLAVRPVPVRAVPLVKAALRLRPDLRAREEEARRVDAEISLARRSIVPNPTIGGTYEEEAAPDGRDRIFGGSVSVPIPVFDRNQGELTALAGERSRAASELRSTALGVETEVRDAVRSYEAAREAARLFERSAAARTEESFTLIETAYDEGKIDLLRLVTAENELVDARIAHLEAVWALRRARIALENAVGAPIEEVTKP